MIHNTLTSMVTNELQQYIIQQLQDGCSEDAIRDILVQSGWDIHSVNDAFGSIHNIQNNNFHDHPSLFWYVVTALLASSLFSLYRYYNFIGELQLSYELLSTVFFLSLVTSLLLIAPTWTVVYQFHVRYLRNQDISFRVLLRSFGVATLWPVIGLVLIVLVYLVFGTGASLEGSIEAVYFFIFWSTYCTEIPFIYRGTKKKGVGAITFSRIKVSAVCCGGPHRIYECKYFWFA